MTRGKAVATAVVVVLAAVWLLSGVIGKDPEGVPPTLAEARNAAVEARADQAPTVVRGRRSLASKRPRMLKLRGRTVNKYEIVVRAESSGLVVERPIENGATVATGDLLCQLEINEREAMVLEARDAVDLANLEYEGVLRLRDRGLQQESDLARARAGLSSAQRQLAANEKELAKTAVRAPVRGYVEQTHANVGDYVQPGSPCATVLDLDPIFVVASISEQNVAHAAVGTLVDVVLSTGSALSGPLTFIGKQSTDESRTFRIEVTVANPGYDISAGLTGQLTLRLETHSAHLVPTALFALDDAGELGVRTVDDRQRVEFHKIGIVSEDEEGVWVSGLPDDVVLITVGQELVNPGERVEVQYESRS